LEEVVVMGVVDVANDRTTPVAVSTITAIEIQKKSGNTEFTDILKNTPSIYVHSAIGGFGDSQVFTRGFDQSNTAFLLNGQPITNWPFLRLEEQLTSSPKRQKWTKVAGLALQLVMMPT
jgi:outer membrane receptor for ferrienterochelin and colicin